MNDLTVVVLTKNEEANIVDVIKNAKQVTPHVLIVDSGSTDKTVWLAEEHGAKVVYRAWDNDFSAQRNFALEHVATEWVLYLDADERLNKELCEAVVTVLEEGTPASYRMVRKNSAFGRDFNYGVLGPDSVVRLFPTAAVKWVDKVHERPVTGLEEKLLKGYIKHYTYDSFATYLEKMNVYSSMGAENNKAKGKNVSVIGDLVLRPVYAFFKMYFLKKGCLEGWLGFVLCLNYANYTLNKYVKLKLMKERARKSL
ncbi:glycosyltransferase family 2 protein [Phascolarctobacterium sp.]|uniref:glycosyltransferase family 2 protein n=1 Tax=Phascolarctobacterium sp. TaxID=2049039 RepID=UPI003865CF9F